MKVLSYLRNHYNDITRIFLFLAALVFLVLILPKEGKFKYEFIKGKPWMHDDLIAPFDFAILKSPEEIKKEQFQLLDSQRPYFRYNKNLVESQRKAMNSDFNNQWKSGNQEWEGTKEKNQSIALTLYDSIMSRGILETVPEIASKPAEFPIYIIRDNVVEEKKSSDFFTIKSADEYIHGVVSKQHEIDKNLLITVLENAIFQNFTFDKETTEKEKDELMNRVSTTRGLIQSGERIIARGELVNGEKFQILQSLKIEYESKLGSSFKFAGILLGQIILLAVSLFSLFLFLYFFRVDIFGENKIIVLVLLLIISMVATATLVLKFTPVYVYLIPVCLGPIIIAVFTDTRLALFSHLITIIIIGFLVPNSYEYVFLQLFAGIVTILSTVKLERRSQFFFTSLMIFLVYSIIYIGMTLIKEGSLRDVNYFYFGLFGGSALLTLFSYPIIFVFEKLFGMITNVTLLELSNTNNKLLRELALRAPGTFQHSMQMANLAEDAIHEIGGNPLLVRTGAMYHDIGKMEDPLYFVENQTTGLNPHDELTREESAEIIIEHIPRGVEKAKRHNLPEQIIDFIRTHHGTRRTEYFYTLAKRENPDEEIDERIYTYPGPEPFSKETAVLMMADTVEAASRSLKNPDEASIDKLVEAVITKQMESHQFDNAEITLRDIRRIKQIFKKKLMNIYHLRIEYPT